ncbi:DEAD (Asp-Glu-Ala-Asp) box polypeptide 59 [Lobosporangium transversale]|nr:DEAD (Asp-Glu-Ala-Asp) box polypeptide 59 [Lobosporangium transversale]
MLVPRTVSARKTNDHAGARLPSLAEANALLTLQRQHKEQQQQQLKEAVNSIQYNDDHGHTDDGYISPRGVVETSSFFDGAVAMVSHTLSQRPPQDIKLASFICGCDGELTSNTTQHFVCRQNSAHEPPGMISPIFEPHMRPQLQINENAIFHSEVPHLRSYSSSRIVASITGYRDSPRTESLSTKEVKALRESLHIHVQGKHAPKPIQCFEDCSLPTKLLSNLVDNGFTQPRDVQMQAIPAGLYGRDMIISAETGSGKTAAFLIPIITHVYGLAQLPGDGMIGPYALIIAPTRELAMQIEDVTKKMVRVATPGRILDILTKQSEVSFSNVFCLVLDEVDLMFSMGFRKQMKKILDILPEPPNGRQSIVCSATITKQVEQLIGTLMNSDHLRIRVGAIKEQASIKETSNPKFADVFSPASKIKQTVIWIENGSKKKQLLSLLKDAKYFRPPVLVFVESRIGAELLAHVIRVKCPGITTVAMHGDKSPEERIGALKLITDGAIEVIVATGLLARGLDLKVATVINFDMAPSLQEYVHRVGRANPEAARKAAVGIKNGPRLRGMAWAITFINSDHQYILAEFANMLHKLEFDQVTPLPPELKRLVVSHVKHQASTTQTQSIHENKNPMKREADDSSQARQQSHSLSQRGKKKKNK